MSNLKKKLTLIVICFMSATIVLSALALSSEEADAWVFGGMKQPKTSIEHEVGVNPQSIYVADINNDTNLDIITANAGSNDVSVLLGDGKGNFIEAVYSPFPVGYWPWSVFVTDINNDTIPDIITANYLSNNISILFGHENGNFTEAEKSPRVGTNPWSVFVSYIDDDTIPDIITANGGSNDVSVLIGVGDGNFTDGKDYSVGTNPKSVFVTDIDNDKNMDIITANSGSNDISILLGDGKANFTKLPHSPSVDRNPFSIYVIDINNDSKPDIITANHFDYDVSVLLGDGNGYFTEADNSPFLVGSLPSSVYVADVNGDFNMDIVTANSYTNDVSVLLGDGNGNFSDVIQSPYPVGGGPSSIFMADLNGDNIMDIITANSYSDDVSVLLGHGYGNFFTPANERLNLFEIESSPISIDSLPISVFVTGTDKDGFMYIITANAMSNSVCVLFRKGSGPFTLATNVPLVDSEPSSVFASDVNDDDFSDIITANFDSDTVSILKGSGGGSFTKVPNSPSVGKEPSSVFVADINNDTNQDIITANWGDDSVTVLLGDGRENFTEADKSPFYVGTGPSSVFVTDVNRDNKPDIITANEGSNDVSVLIGNGDKDFNITSNKTFPVGEWPSGVFVVDINNDDVADIITANWRTNDVSVLLGDGNNNFTDANTYPVGTGPSNVFVIDINGDDIPDIISLNERSDDVTILLGDGTGDFPEAPISPFPIGSEPRSLYVANVIGDEKPDIITTNKKTDKMDNTVRIHEVFVDFDYDGVPDEYDALPANPTEWEDFDHDLIGNNADPDDDNDGIPDPAPGLKRDKNNNNNGNYDEGEYDEFQFDRTEWVDTDGDGIGNNADDDDDNDGRMDYVEGLIRDADNNNDGIYDDGVEYDEFPYDRTEWVDTDADGTGNNADKDDDNDTVPDYGHGYVRDRDNNNNGIYDEGEYDEFPYDRTEWVDTDADGVGNNEDNDDDNDGRMDHVEGLKRDADNNNDGIYDDGVEYDEFPYDRTEWVDTDADGTGNNEDTDDDNDEIPDEVPGLVRDKENNNNGIYDDGEYDELPLDRTEWVDTDADGIGNNEDTDDDNDYVLDEDDAFPLDATEWNDTDSDGIGDNTDQDIDGDGVPNEDDAYPWDPSRHEETTSFFGITMNIHELFYSTTILTLYSMLSTGFFYISKKGIFLTFLFYFNRRRKVPLFKKEIQKMETFPDLNELFEKVKDEKLKDNINIDQYDLLKEEADKKRVALSYAALASLTQEQQFIIFNEILSRNKNLEYQYRTYQEDRGIIGEEPVEYVAKEKDTIGMQKTAKAEVSDGIVDRVHFTVTAPPAVQPRSSFVVDLWAHLEEQKKAVIEQAQQMAVDEKVTIRSVGPKHVTRGTVLSAELKIEDLIIEYPVKTILWEGEIGNANFPVRVPEDVAIGSKQGTAKIFIDGLRIAMIHFIIRVGEQTTKVDEIPIEEERHQNAFASYARSDRDQVFPRIQGIQKAAPNMNIFLDVLSLRSGQNWEDKIREAIPSNDIFYLFWSASAKRSKWVEKEWRCALETRGIDFIDPVPLVSPEIVPPPPELAEKHFDDWTLAFMRSETLSDSADPAKGVK